MKSGLRGFWISNVSQVPAAVGLTARHDADVYPRPGPKAVQTFLYLVLARAIMKGHRAAFGVGDEAGFDEARQVITNAYTGSSDELKKTWDEAPKHRDPAINDICRTWLNYDRGDDVLQLGRCSLRSMWRFFSSHLPENAAVQIAWQAVSIPQHDARGRPLRASADLDGR